MLFLVKGTIGLQQGVAGICERGPWVAECMVRREVGSVLVILVLVHARFPMDLQLIPEPL